MKLSNESSILIGTMRRLGLWSKRPSHKTVAHEEVAVPPTELPEGFDSALYLRLNPDVAQASIDAGTHYYYHGRREGRPYQLGASVVAEQQGSERDTASVAYNMTSAEGTDPTVIAAGLDPLGDAPDGAQWQVAAQEQPDLPGDFDGDVYLALHADLASGGVDPARHYVDSGRAEGRIYLRPPVADRRSELPDDFDASMYLALNADLRGAVLDPALHYLEHGRYEGRQYSVAEAALVQVGVDAVPLHGLPADFDSDLYRKLHPDLADSSIDPATHYLRHGQAEGRIYSFPAMELVGVEGWLAHRPTVLVVSHEASRTGAPVLSLNLVQLLRERYNVVALLLGGGALYDAFCASGAIVVNVPTARGNSVLAEHLVEHLSQRFPLKFALVNSIESRIVLAPLAAAFVPVISLVHEFASYTRPRDAFRSALLWSGEVVFSAHVTMENAFAEYPDLGPRGAHILPQGRCLLPEGDANPVLVAKESARLRRLIRPPHAQHDVVVLGAGFVQLRKGVELFLECAARMVRAPGGDRCRFVWIGRGYDPDHDIQYSVYLADQIRRAGLQRHVLFIDETSAIETAYEEADLLLLSSRLDPLPNVAIDAMASGVPVLCFDKTTGIADFLIESGLQEPLVADYLDTSALAQKALALALDPVLRDQVAQRCRDAAATYFSMDRYVAQLETLAEAVALRSRQEQADTATILASGLFRADFASPAHRSDLPLAAQVRQYVRTWSSGIDRRKPMPGFHPGVYLEQHGVAIADADPFADYLRAGQPPGPWNYPLVTPGTAALALGAVAGRVALHLHVYYADLLPDMVERLALNTLQPDLFISIADDADRPQVEAALAHYLGRIVAIERMPNRGRDIGPMLTAFRERLMGEYDFIGHLHTKKSIDVRDKAMGVKWYHFLLENLLGGAAGASADAAIAAMQADATIGMVFPGDPYVLGLGANRTHALELGARLGLAHLPEHFMFPVGSMFWARTAALAPIMDLAFDWDDYPDEPLPYDGTMLHALERLFALSLPLSNLRIAATNIQGLTR